MSKKFSTVTIFLILLWSFCDFSYAGGHEVPEYPSFVKDGSFSVLDTTPDAGRIIIRDIDKKENPFDLKDPKSVEREVEYDPESGLYKITEKIGSDYYKPPTYMTADEYMQYRTKEEDDEFLKNLAGISSAKRSISGAIDPITKVNIQRNLADRIFGGLGVEIKPVGSVGLSLGGYYSFNDNPSITEAQKTQWGPLFDPDIQLDVQGSVGDKLKLNTNYNTQATFGFENKLKLEYDSQKFSEDDIIKKIEAGNVSMPLKSNLIQGSQNLFGFKTDWQFGHLKLTGLVSQQKSKQESIKIQGGSVVQEFEIRPDQYDENRHFFLNDYFRNSYEENLKNLPEVTSKFKIKNLEVWLTDDAPNSRELDFRDIIALTDLGTPTNGRWDYENPGQFTKPSGVPVDAHGAQLYTNESNLMSDVILKGPKEIRELSEATRALTKLGLKQGRDFDKVRAKRLSSNEYTFNPDLGFISLRIKPRPNQVLAVSYQYTYAGQVKDIFADIQYKVGEFSSEIKSDSTNYRVLFTKMLKSSNQSTNSVNYDLMMKNVYSIGGYNLSEDNFSFDIYYEAQDGKQKRYIEELEGYPLLNLFRLDFLNQTKDPQPDGVFDFVQGQTIIPVNGNVIFPVLEPFGNSLKPLLEMTRVISDPAVIDKIVEKYSYPELYDTSVTIARSNLTANQFLLKGKFKSGKSNEINLRAVNLDPNSKVTVTAGSLPLVEGRDYTFDRNLGKITILNEAYLSSGVPINVNFEDNSLYSFQTKTLLGFRAEYSKRKDFYIGGTYMHLFERPFTQKVNIGEDPINNRIFGLDFGLSKDAPWMTRVLDKLPFYSTKEPSKWSLQAEGAYLKPGHSRAINQTGSEGGVIYIDDFEGSSSGIGLHYNVTQWVLASKPQGIDNEPSFSEDDSAFNTLFGSSNRALLSWYRIDEYSRQGAPDASATYTRAVQEKEIFPSRSIPPGYTPEITFDLTYYPREKGPYNYDIPGGIQAGAFRTAGVDNQNNLLEPQTRWAGIMSKLSTNDFEAANVEYIDFWLLNPFMQKYNQSPVTSDGNMYIQLGSFSEDIFKDGKQQFENGLPTTSQKVPTEQTVYGKISKFPPIVNGFDISERSKQDIGYDGLNTFYAENEKDEKSFFKDYLDVLSQSLATDKYTLVAADPSNDDYVSYRDSKFQSNGATVLERYKRYNMPEGNGGTQESANAIASTAYSLNPDQEDINSDKSLNELESYFNYTIPLKKTSDNKIAYDPNDPNNRITQERIVQRTGGDEVWYRFRIPINESDKKIGEIQDFRSIQAIRVAFAGFSEQVTFRMIKLQLGRNTWRRYSTNVCEDFIDKYPLIVDKVDIEENSNKLPFHYLSPPGIQREKLYSGQYSNLEVNEASLLLRKENLYPKCEQSVYKILDLDMRRYEKLKMFVHAESSTQINKGDTKIFLRLGKDFTNNYYEYEIPLRMSTPDAVSVSLKDSIWLSENSFDFPLSLLVDLKNERNKLNIPFDQEYVISDPANPEHVVKIKGNPTLGLVRGALIGFKNETQNIISDIEVWVNEFRLTGLEEKGGFAALARGELTLSDLGNISLAGNYSSVGWGGLDQKLEDRAIEEVVQYDATTNLELGKFLPKKSGLRVPLSLQVSNAVKTPLYDPIDTDVKLKDKIDQARNTTERDSIKDRAIDRARITSFALNNVRKERTGSKKPMPWDIENFGLSYQQSHAKKSNPIVANEEQKNQQGSLDYNYSMNPLYIEPFKKVVNSNSLKFIKEINFNLIPNSISVRNNLDRKYAIRTYRYADPRYSTWEDTRFGWNRDYTLNWDLTRSIKFSFNASNEATIDQITYDPLVGSDVDPITRARVDDDKRTSYLWDQLGKFGRTKEYKHNFTASYNLPTRLIPALDWVTARAQYTANYNWSAGSLLVIDSIGSVIGNGQNITLNGELNFSNLYNKSSYLRKINGEGSQRSRPSVRKSNQSNQKTDKKDDDKKTKKEKEKKERNVSIGEKIALRPLLILRRIQLNYTQNKTTVVPGYLEYTNILGMDQKFTNPGWSFVAGIQPKLSGDFLNKLADRGVISDNYCQNKEVLQREVKTFGSKMKLEPFRDFNIDISLDRNRTNDYSEAFRYGPNPSNLQDTGFFHFTPYETGQYTISFISLNTLFNKDIDGLFNTFSERRTVISQRLGAIYNITTPNPNAPAYIDGFSGDHQDVIIPAFLSAYTNTDPNKVKLNVLNSLPLPNWQISYNGLTKLKGLKNIFQDLSIRHSYSNKLSVSNYKTSLDYKEDNQGIPIKRKTSEANASYYAKLEIANVIIDEKFGPLIGINVKTKSGIELGFDYGKSRTLSLYGNNDGRLEERNSTDLIFKAGYTMKNVYLPFIPGVEKIKKTAKKIKKKVGDPNAPSANVTKPKGNDLQFTLDFGIRDNISRTSVLDLGVQGVTNNGSKQISFAPNILYNINKSLNARLFFDYRKNIPYSTNAYKSVNASGGIAIQFLLN